MPAYLIARVHLRDPSYIEEYRSKTVPLIAKRGGRSLAEAVRGTDSLEPLEGDAPLPTAMFLIEFPSMEMARAFYSDPEYAPMIALRQAGADADIVLVNGL
jgi:uncharacterized protein (DUF1330 family)